MQTSNQDAINANPTETLNSPDSIADTIDYKTKFSESSKEALRLLEEVKVLKAQLNNTGSSNQANESDDFMSKLELMGEEEKQGFIEYTRAVEKRTLDQIHKDPAIAFAKKKYNETVWNDAFDRVANDPVFSDLKETKDEFKQKYFKDNNVPENIEDIIKDLAKSHLFDKAREIGAREAVEKNSDRVDMLRSEAGDKSPTATKTDEEWAYLARTNPTLFAQEYKKATGK